jgi:hypothetical protein
MSDKPVIEAEFKSVPGTSGLMVSDRSIEDAKRQLQLLKDFVQSQMREGVDFGIIPGTHQQSLYKSGAEKLSKMFGLGVRFPTKDKTIDLDSNFAMFSYMAEVYNLQSGTALAQCEGSCNSQEKKYRERTYKGAKENTPIADIMNTLQKMAQKRAYVGAIIQATGASDFYTQDIDTPEDAEQLGMKPGPVRVQASIPKATSARSHDQSQTAPICHDKPMQVSQYEDRALGCFPFYCSVCKAKVAR